MDDSILEALAEKRRACIARRVALKGELTRLASDIAAIDRVMQMINPDLAAPAVEKPARGASGDGMFGPGGTTAAALDALRRLGRATSADCAAAMLVAQGIEADPKLTVKLASRVSAICAQKAAVGQVRRCGNGDGRQVIWESAASGGGPMPRAGFQAIRGVRRLPSRCQYPAMSRLTGWLSADASTDCACSSNGVRRLSSRHATSAAYQSRYLPAMRWWMPISARRSREKWLSAWLVLASAAST